MVLYNTTTYIIYYYDTPARDQPTHASARGKPLWCRLLAPPLIFQGTGVHASPSDPIGARHLATSGARKACLLFPRERRSDERPRSPVLYAGGPCATRRSPHAGHAS